MIVVGGMDLKRDDGRDNLWKTTDRLTRGLGVFDLNELKWRDKYDPEAAEYKAPDMVRGWYEDGYRTTHPPREWRVLLTFEIGASTT